MHTHIWITEEPHGDKIPRMVSFLTLGTVGERPDGVRISQMVSVTLCAVKFRRETKSPSCSMLSNLPLCSDHGKQARVHVMRNCLKIATKCCLYGHYFFKLCKYQRFSPVFCFQAQNACRMRQSAPKWSRRGSYFGTADAVWAQGYLRFEPGAWKWNEALPCLSADCKILMTLILFKFSHSISDWTAVPWNVLRIFLETFLEGSVYHIIYIDYIVNRSSLIFL